MHALVAYPRQDGGEGRGNLARRMYLCGMDLTNVQCACFDYGCPLPTLGPGCAVLAIQMLFTQACQPASGSRIWVPPPPVRSRTLATLCRPSTK